MSASGGKALLSASSRGAPAAAGPALLSSTTALSAIIALVGIATFSLFSLGEVPAPSSHMHDQARPDALPLFLAKQLSASALRRLSRRLVSPAQVAFEDALGGFALSVELHTACKLRPRLADAMGNEGKTAAQVAETIGAREEGRVRRLLAALAAHGYFQAEEQSNGEPLWYNSALSSMLRSDHPNDMCPLISHLVEDSVESWLRLPAYVVGADNATSLFENVHGAPVWSWFGRHPTQAAQFQKAREKRAEPGTAGVVARPRSVETS
jgi:hypothetical protein